MTYIEDKNELNKKICEFIKARFFSPYKLNGEETSLNKYAKACNLSSSTISKIKDAEGYNIPISTIYAICNVENLSLNLFFEEFENQMKKS
ncbi:helix-turn-helix domain-containing protein [Sphingobacterium litopenaei]|uniref:HTH cro/C1-type domain-containing protein n=1 Tax=Sphingobacterium litopenaei TaxID=2763500 RepID=A0ABR7YB09_9SPHI|nr:hypothetical protein [Sphingobacterium litopenaei]MBD1428504.1 hypothetical protein [Sphingobacterium litopenaei]